MRQNPCDISRVAHLIMGSIRVRTIQDQNVWVGGLNWFYPKVVISHDWVTLAKQALKQ